MFVQFLHKHLPLYTGTLRKYNPKRDGCICLLAFVLVLDLKFDVYVSIFGSVVVLCNFFFFLCVFLL